MLAAPPDPGGDHRQPGRERLEEGKSVRLVRAGQREGVGRVQERDDVALPPDEEHTFRHSGGSGLPPRRIELALVATDDEQEYPGRISQCLHEQREALSAELVSDEGNDSIVPRVRASRARAGAPGRRWVEAVEVHPVRDHYNGGWTCRKRDAAPRPRYPQGRPRRDACRPGTAGGRERG